MPEGVQASKLTSSYSAEGILTIEAPRLLEVPEGASVQEALAANSRAYTTDEGRTSVNEKSSASSQVSYECTRMLKKSLKQRSFRSLMPYPRVRMAGPSPP